jgi:ABC-type branched-subunit amino acid transport system substrate-binding protein
MTIQHRRSSVARFTVRLAIVALLGVGAITGTRPRQAAAGNTLNVGVNAPFTGTSAIIGTHFVRGVEAAVWDINHNGGVLGNNFNVVRADDQDDAADGVAAINKLLAIDQPVAVFGPSSDTATAVVPIINRSQIVDWCLCGTTQLDHMTWKYIYRPSPGDSLQGAAVALWAHRQGYTRAAFVFNSDTGSQTLVSPEMSTFTTLGGKATINIKLLPDQSNYRSEVQEVLNSHPQVIFSEMDPPTAATFYSEELQLGGKLLPSLQSDTAAGADFYNALKKTVGQKQATTFITVMSVYSPTTPGSAEFLNAYHHVYPGQAPLEFNTNGYDAMNISALAMLEAKSTTSSVWINKIASITADTKGVHVATFAQGKTAILAGKSVYYAGATGPIIFNKYHNSSGNFEATKFNPDGTLRQIGAMPAQVLQPYVH